MATRDALIAYARQTAVSHGVNPDIFVRQIDAESSFDPSAQSSAGAQGIAQIVPAYHPGVNVWDPFASLDYAASLDASYLHMYNGRYDLMLAAYNAGPGAVQQYGGVPPYPETQQYIREILGSTSTMPAATSPAESTITPLSGGAVAALVVFGIVILTLAG